MANPIVYGPAFSTYVWSARLALAEKGVTHELVDVPFGAHREEPHLSRQPFAKIPAFEHDGFALYGTQVSFPLASLCYHATVPVVRFCPLRGRLAACRT